MFCPTSCRPQAESQLLSLVVFMNHRCWFAVMCTLTLKTCDSQLVGPPLPPLPRTPQLVSESQQQLVIHSL